MSKDLDIVVFGATGFSGKRVCLELQRVIEEKEYGYKWAIAGRRRSKLEEVLREIKRHSKTNFDVDIIEADVNDHRSLVEMCQQARVVFDCVGPYKLYGEQVVKACVEGKSDYIDITGEPDYLRMLRVKYNDVAAEKNIFIIGACGFDSIPSDMGAVFARRNFPGTLNSLDCYFKLRAGPEGVHLNHGTYDSAILAMADSNVLEDLKRLNAKVQTVGPREKMKSVHRNNELNCYAMPFLGPDIEIVRTSQQFFYDKLNLPPIQYNMYLSFPRIWYLFGIILFFINVKIWTLTNWGTRMLMRHPKFFSAKLFSHEGPTEAQIKGTSFCLYMTGKGYSDGRKNCGRTDKPDKSISIKVQGPELAYVTTPIVMVQAGISLLLDRLKIPCDGGALTPASAFSETTIIERMHERGVTFDVVEN